MDDLKAKLEQVDDDIQALREVKSKIVQQIADSEVTYSIGDRFSNRGGFEFLLIEIDDGVVTTVRLTTGGGYLAGSLTGRSPKLAVANMQRITSQEFAELSARWERSVRTYDARKQCKC